MSMVTELFGLTQKILSCVVPCPQNMLISAWQLLKESLDNYKKNCNECQLAIKRLTKSNDFSPRSDGYEVARPILGTEEFDARKQYCQSTLTR